MDMKKIICLTALLLGGCETMQPVEMGLEISALGGLVKVAPKFTVGDGEVGPTSVDVEIAEAKPEGE